MRYFLVVSYLCCAAILCGLPGTPPAGVARDANEALTADVHFRGPVALVVSADGRRLLTANRRSGSISMLAVVSTENLGLVWVAVEATTVFSAILVGFYRTRDALEAAWKYLIICSVGVAFGLYGTVLTFANASANRRWASLVGTTRRPPMTALLIAPVLIIS